MKRWKEYTQKQEKEVFSNLYKYGVLYLGTTLMMISPFIIDSIYGKIGNDCRFNSHHNSDTENKTI